jgi:endonuclease/exonuclease/phosphatase family metal-dependent hydrolase
MRPIFYKLRQLYRCNQNYKHHFKSNKGVFTVIKKENTNNFIKPAVYKLNSINYGRCIEPFYENQNIDINLKKITTWNVQELFWYCYKGNKINNIIDHIKQFDSDIICLQEVFESYSFELIVNNKYLKERYPFYLTGTQANRFIIGENSGLLVLSKYPIKFHQFTQFHQTTFPDILACKGALYFSVGDTNFITTHLQSECPRIAKRQLHYILNESPFTKKTILLGDLNINDACDELGLCTNNNMITHLWSSSKLDYILNITNDVQLDIDIDHFSLENCSDHWPVHASFLYTNTK